MCVTSSVFYAVTCPRVLFVCENCTLRNILSSFYTLAIFNQFYIEILYPFQLNIFLQSTIFSS